MRCHNSKPEAYETAACSGPGVRLSTSMIIPYRQQLLELSRNHSFTLLLQWNMDPSITKKSTLDSLLSRSAFYLYYSLYLVRRNNVEVAPRASTSSAKTNWRRKLSPGSYGQIPKHKDLGFLIGYRQTSFNSCHCTTVNLFEIDVPCSKDQWLSNRSWGPRFKSPRKIRSIFWTNAPEAVHHWQ